MNSPPCLHFFFLRRTESINSLPQRSPAPPSVIDVDGQGSHTFRNVSVTRRPDQSWPCPETHFQCPGDGYCLPVYVRCNGVNDCPGREDEEGCDSNTCPGFYRCRGSSVCLHADHVCDAVFQCPQHDDELLCDVTCPPGCTCYGLAFTCTGTFAAALHPDLRYVDVSGGAVTPDTLSTNTMLVHLSVARSRLTAFGGLSFPNLNSLDLSDNSITALGRVDFRKLGNLRIIFLANNPLTSVVVVVDVKDSMSKLSPLTSLDLTNTKLKELNISRLAVFPDLHTLNLSGSGTERVVGGFQPLQKMSYVDLRGCPMTSFPPAVFQGLGSLQAVHADNFRLCCPALLPEGFNLKSCFSPSDHISSCNLLLRHDAHRFFVGICAAVGFVGNIGSFVVNTIVSKPDSRGVFRTLITHLCVSDFLMSVYLAIIFVADRIYQGSFLREEWAWRRSLTCQVAGFLSLLSSEVSAFVICLITAERVLTHCLGVQIQPRSAKALCATVWSLGLVIAALPLFPGTSGGQSHSDTALCNRLPMSWQGHQGHEFVFGVIVVLNLALHVLIAGGQGCVLYSIGTGGGAATSAPGTSRDADLAWRQFYVVTSNVLCWLTLTLLVLLDSGGSPVSAEVNAAMAVFVMPLNSALNPCLYALHVVLQRRRLAREARLMKLLSARVAPSPHPPESSKVR